jgi:hypothetical protein
MNYSKQKISNRLLSFRKYCIDNNFELRHDDYAFIDSKLSLANKTDFKAILDVYLENWAQGMIESSIGSSAQSDGRKRANLWLLEYSDLKKGKAPS